MTVAIALERYIAVHYPLHYNHVSHCEVKKSQKNSAHKKSKREPRQIYLLSELEVGSNQCDQTASLFI